MSSVEFTPFRERVPKRPTASCPFCSGTVRQRREGTEWLCDACARIFEDSEIEADDESSRENR